MREGEEKSVCVVLVKERSEVDRTSQHQNGATDTATAGSAVAIARIAEAPKLQYLVAAIVELCCYYLMA